MSNKLVDFHCHLDLYPDFGDLVRECDQYEVYTLAVTTTPRAWMRNQELASSTKHVRAALGLHPQLIVEHASEIELWEKLLPKSRYVGEVGLDGSPKFYKSLSLQKDIFYRILTACAKSEGKIISIHSYRAVSIVLDMIEECMPKHNGKIILHWFTGTQSEAKRAIKLGCFFSLNEQMLENERLCKIITTIPIERLLTETDGPFIRHNGKSIRPKDVIRCITKLAELRGVDGKYLQNQIVNNLRELLCEESGGMYQANNMCE